MQRSRNYNIGGKLDYHFDDRNTFSAWAWFYPSFFNMDADFDVSRIEYINHPGDYSYRSDVDTRMRYFSGNVGAYYQHKFDTAGREIEFNWNGGLTSGHDDRIRQRQYANFPALDFTRHSKLDQWGSRNDLYVDYTFPYGKGGKIEVGAEYHYKPLDKTHHLDTLAGGIYQRDSVRSYVFNALETDLTFYLTVQQKIGRLTLKGGLRGENQWLQHKHNIASCDFDKYYFGLVPSIHASYSTENNHNFTLSYTRRFDTPDIAKLSPFVIYADDSYTVGNPNLRMAYSHKAEAGWTHYTKWGSIGVEGYLNLSTNNFAQVSDVAYSPYFGRVVQMDTSVILGNSRFSGAELNFTWRPRKFMNIRLYVNGGEVWYRMQVRPGEWVEDEAWSYIVRLNMNAKLWGKVDVFVNSKFVGRQIEFLSRREPNFNVDFGLSTDLFDHHLSLY
ncbi:MAG: TonB-dependent receptor, partial [Bacteroidales bacterium]|nr:TonB-dependent receptor [Bacteroidales bacterium]